MDDKSIKMRWVQEVQFLDSQSVIGIRFSKPILPLYPTLVENLLNMLYQIGYQQWVRYPYL
jgi:plasmid replication initiation protein